MIIQKKLQTVAKKYNFFMKIIKKLHFQIIISDYSNKLIQFSKS